MFSNWLRLSVFAVFPLGDSYQLAGLAPGGDVFLGGLGGDGKGVGSLEEGPGVKLGGEVGPELLLAEGAGIGRGLERRGDVGKGVVHGNDVLQEDAADVECILIVIFPAGDVFAKDAVFHHPENREDHGDAESNEAQAAHGGDDVHVAAED